MFKHAYESFKPWQRAAAGEKRVFFYLCMEEHSLWQKTFGYNYFSNTDFERDMLCSYAEKLGMEYLF
jgi:spore photoproduct lyase